MELYKAILEIITSVFESQTEDKVENEAKTSIWLFWNFGFPTLWNHSCQVS